MSSPQPLYSEPLAHDGSIELELSPDSHPMDDMLAEKCVINATGTLELSSEDGSQKVNGGQWISKPKHPLTACLNRLVPHGGTISNVYSMASITLGSGIVTLPFAFRSMGIFTSIVVLIAITLCTVYSIYLLMTAVDKTGRTLRCYQSLARGLLGHGWDYFTAFNLFMFCFGSCVSYVISVQDLIRNACDGESVTPFLRSAWGSRVLTIVVWLCVMLPLSLPKQVNSLRYVSVIGVTFMMYFVIVMIANSAMYGFENGKPIHKIKPFETGNTALIGFSMFIFAYLCQTNTFELYEEMLKPSPARLTRDCAISMSICTTLYVIAGVFGYIEFGDALSGSVLRLYNVRDDAMVAVSYFGLGFKLCVSFAMCMQPSRDALYYCFGCHVRTIGYLPHILICSTLSIIALVLGLAIPNVEIVFSLVGSFCGGFLGFIYPVLFIMYSGDWSLKKVGYFHFICTYILLFAGVIAVIFGTVAAVYGVIIGD